MLRTQKLPFVVTGLGRGSGPILGLCLFFGISAMTFVSFVSSADAPPAKKLRHVVQFMFKSTSSEQDIAKVVEAFRALPAKISEVADFEYGTDNSPEGLANGYTHCFLLTFASEATRDIYLKHSEHQKFVELLKPHLEKAQVLDYWATK